ncbi:MAG TPA: hypothetical protein VJ203_08265 [Bacteroidales bacterium]|nr:hypothetical protein [Bacteroidales bacterium]
MKNIACILSSAFALILLISSCKPKVNPEQDTEDIKSVINAETQAWIDKNPDKMKEYYIQDEFQTRLNIQDSIYSITTGWDKRSTAIDTLAKYADWVGVDHFKVEKEFLAIKIMDNTAWAILKETQNMTYHGSPATTVALINVVLEKVGGDWKISCFVKSNI